MRVWTFVTKKSFVYVHPVPLSFFMYWICNGFAYITTKKFWIVEISV